MSRHLIDNEWTSLCSAINEEKVGRLSTQHLPFYHTHSLLNTYFLLFGFGSNTFTRFLFYLLKGCFEVYILGFSTSKVSFNTSIGISFCWIFISLAYLGFNCVKYLLCCQCRPCNTYIILPMRYNISPSSQLLFPAL